jgi:hypothetical protein
VFLIDSDDTQTVKKIIDVSLGGLNNNCKKIALHGTGMYSASVCGNSIETGTTGYIVIVSYLSSDPVAVYHR